MLWQQKRGLFLVTLSGEESSSSSCSSMPWCMGVSCPSFLLPGGLLGKGVMWVAVLGLILSSVAGAGGGTEAHQVCVSPAPGCAKLCCSGSSSGSCPALGDCGERQEMHGGTQGARMWPGTALAQELSVGSLPGEADGVWFCAPEQRSCCELN